MTTRFSDRISEVSVAINQHNEVWVYGHGGKGDGSFTITIGDGTLLGVSRVFDTKLAFDNLRDSLTDKARKIFAGRSRKFIREFIAVMSLINDAKT